MQQPVNNRWLSPALRNLAADNAGWTAERQQDLYRAGLEAREAILLQTTGARRGRGRLDRPRVYGSQRFPVQAAGQLAGGASALRTTSAGAGMLRQVVLIVAMAGLLLGSIAFSLLAWSGTLTPAGVADAWLQETPAHVDSQPAKKTGARLPPAAANASGARETNMSPAQRVRLLRQENGRLHERATALRSQLR